MGKHKVVVTDKAERDLANLPRTAQRRLVSRIESLADNPRPRGCRKLEAEENIFRLRVGDYRILYNVADTVITVLVLRIRHRRDAYRT